MKNLLILLMFSFVFTQSIQTKELVFSIDENTTSIDIASEIEMQENELYILTPFFISDFEVEDCSFNDTDENTWEIHFRTNNYPMMINQEIDLDYDCDSEDDDGQLYCEYYFEARHAVLSLDNSILYSDVSEFCPTFSGNIYFRISGMFEDEGFGLQGDMDNNNILNVVDVIALVNTILD